MRQNRRTKRSDHPEEALQYLMEAVHDRSDVRAIALVDENGRIVAGTGTARDLVVLAWIARPIVKGEPCVDLGHVTFDTDILAREIKIASGSLYLAALGDRVRKMPEAAKSVERILARAA